MSWCRQAWKAMGALLILTAISRIQGESCCGDGECDESCPWIDSCDDGQDLDCKDSIAGIFRCRDRDSCNDFDECDDYHAALRAGNICKSSPYYNGGYPLDNIQWDNEDEEYTCYTSPNGQYCNVWLTAENSPSEMEGGNATCTKESKNGFYCQEWHIEQAEYKKCWDVLTYFDCSDDNEGYERCVAVDEFCCDENGQDDYLTCCKEACDPSFYNSNGRQEEYSDCECKKESDNGQYCWEWYCEEYLHQSDRWEDGREQEYYTCTEESSNAQYCKHWIGAVDSREEFEVSKCKCRDESNSGNFCSHWECKENGVDYWWPNMLWALLPALLGALPVIVLIATAFVYKAGVNWTQLVYLGMLVIIWTGGFCMIGIWKAGLGVLYVNLIPTVGFYIMLVVYLAWCHCFEDSDQSSKRSKFPGWSNDNYYRQSSQHETRETSEDYPQYISPEPECPRHIQPPIPSAPVAELEMSVLSATEVAVAVEAHIVDASDEANGGKIEAELIRLKSLYERGLIAADYYEMNVTNLLTQIE